MDFKNELVLSFSFDFVWLYLVFKCLLFDGELYSAVYLSVFCKPKFEFMTTLLFFWT